MVLSVLVFILELELYIHNKYIIYTYSVSYSCVEQIRRPGQV